MERRKFIQSLAGASAGFPVLSPALLRYELDKSLKTVKVQDRLDHIYDVAVIGVGSMGSAALYYAAKRGASVLGLEQFTVVHDHGSHFGQSRIIRKAYFEHPDYVPLLERAYSNWKALERESGYQFFHKTGLLYIGRPEHTLLKGVRQSASRYSIPIEEYGALEIRSKFPQFKIPDDYEVIVEPDAGFVTPEKTILAYTQQAIQLGAEVREKEQVLKWEVIDDIVQITTSVKVFKAKRIIITAGGYSKTLIPHYEDQLEIRRQLVAWVKPKKWEEFTLGFFPCWTIADEDKPGIYYGFPILDPGKFFGPIGLKVAHHFPGKEIEPGQIHEFDSRQEEQKLASMMERFMPEAFESVLSVKSCLYSYSPDENFIIDRLEGYEDHVTVACGFSGHGFKFVPVVGEVLADLALEGETSQPIGFLSYNRFQGQKD